jgi:three-Cys-motif partner protein
MLRQYVPPFLAKVGSTAPGGRVVFVDGFAGRGRFDDGTRGSAVYFLDAAVERAPKVRASVRLFEVNPADAARLHQVVAEYVGHGVDALSENADVNNRIREVVLDAGDAPLFLLLDPCGQNLPFETMLEIFRDQRPQDWPATEAVLNLSADFTRRIGGTLLAGLNDAAGLRTMDTMMGGAWWRGLAVDVHAATPDGKWGDAADAVAAAYLQKLCRETRMLGTCTPVRRKPHHQPTYHLAHVTRSMEGLWVMADAIARARQRWLVFNGAQEGDPEADMLFDFDPVAELIEAEQQAAAARVRQRVIALLDARRQLILRDHTTEVFGEDYGVVSEKTVGAVMKGIVADKLATRVPGDKLHQATFLRSVPRSPGS